MCLLCVLGWVAVGWVWELHHIKCTLYISLKKKVFSGLSLGWSLFFKFFANIKFCLDSYGRNSPCYITNKTVTSKTEWFVISKWTVCHFQACKSHSLPWNESLLPVGLDNSPNNCPNNTSWKAVQREPYESPWKRPMTSVLSLILADCPPWFVHFTFHGHGIVLIIDERHYSFTLMLVMTWSADSLW